MRKRLKPKYNLVSKLESTQLESGRLNNVPHQARNDLDINSDSGH